MMRLVEPTAVEEAGAGRTFGRTRSNKVALAESLIKQLLNGGPEYEVERTGCFPSCYRTLLAELLSLLVDPEMVDE